MNQEHATATRTRAVSSDATQSTSAVARGSSNDVDLARLSESVALRLRREREERESNVRDEALASSDMDDANLVDGSTLVSTDLASVRDNLIRQEESIIFSLIERAQVARNSAIYECGGLPVPGFDEDTGRRHSLLEYVLRQTEQLYGRVRRYTAPDEHAFFPESLPPLVLPPLRYPDSLHRPASTFDINDVVYDMYVHHLLPEVAAEGDDANYGSAALLDVACLQALSKRVHYGMFVAEAKFTAAPQKYTPLIVEKDANGLMELLTDTAVEAQVLKRVECKAAAYGVPPDADGNGGAAVSPKIDPKEVGRLYEAWVMPLTKEVQVKYLLHRLEE